MITVKTGVSAASAAALLALAAVSTPAFADHHGEAKKVNCYGVNSCKGASDCKTADHGCKGQNTCKGTGVNAMTAEACTAAGGTTTEPKKK
ncbi:BufA2 family periplasmic bufferin-type metallophore [Sphingomonas sp. SRS2]|uniref:BufA2 family periplasmic bufferin-type metallophore n=1 Tax=Sphingomonas sp. SRS2 TaxID=133190 RepID=UPI0006184B8F|nr:hypothetical protein [Sphingomonas sp. SRS2]KKC27853.1 hypothetical protein WP12_01385 [Sphingomonas sp. SRS2]